MGAVFECSENFREHQNSDGTQTRGCLYNNSIVSIWPAPVADSVVKLIWLAPLQ